MLKTLTVLSEDFSSHELFARLRKTVTERKKCILLVPEQQTLRTEAAMAAFLPHDAPLYFEATNFSRLANTVFRTVGGISYRYADNAAASLLMWKTLDAVAPHLSAPSAFTEAGRVADTLAAMDELYAAGVDDTTLEKTARLLHEEDRLRARLEDLALIFRTYKGERAETFGTHAEDLDRLAEVLTESSLYTDTVFFVQGFTSFTNQEYKILKALVRQTDVTVSLTLPFDEPHSLCFEETEDTLAQLRKLAEKNGTPFKTEQGARLPLLPATEHARRHLFRSDKKLIPFPEKKPCSLQTVRASDPFDAAAFIASDIAARVQNGARYRDFVIFARSCRPYRGILDVALNEQNIPFFMSEERDIMSFSMIRMILTAYAVIGKDYRKEDVFAYLKCGYSGFSDDDIDVFELYADFWRIHGSAFYQKEDLTMLPSGYGTKPDANDLATLARINTLRGAFPIPLEELKAVTAKPTDVRSHARALYAFLRNTACEEQLLLQAEHAEAAGKSADAETLRRLFGTVCDLLDTAVETVGEMVVSRDAFADMLRILFSSVGLGQLPSSADAVTVGNADMLRADAPETVYLIGANEGEFPAAIKSRGTFEDSERAVLAALGLPIGFDPILRAAREEFCFLRALCAAQKQVIVVAAEEDASGAALYPSAAFMRLEQLFGKSVRASADAYTANAAVSLVGKTAESAQGEALRNILRADAHYADLFDEDTPPLSDTECTLPSELSAELFPQEMHLTQSRIESYANCPFAYYCRYLLSLSEKTDASFGFADIGTMIHAILERVFDVLAKNEKTIRTVKKEDLPGYTEQILRDYIH